MHIGNAIRSLRKQRNISQVSFCTQLGISQPALSQIEQAEHPPAPATLFAIAIYLQVSVPYLYVYSVEEKDSTDPEKAKRAKNKLLKLLTV